MKYELDIKKSLELEVAMKKIPEQAEKLVNDVLHTKGTKQMIQAIIGFMPVSRRDKVHARFSNPLDYEKLNLGFRVYAKGGAANKKGSFGYLVFPDEGRGSSNPIAQKFFERGLKQTDEQIINQVLKALEEATKI